MTTTSDTKVAQVVINRLSQTQFNNATSLENNEVYAVDPEFGSNRGVLTDSTGDLITKPLVNDSTSTSVTLDNAVAGTDYHYGTLTSLTITANDTSDNEITIYFTAGSTITVTLPNTLQYIGSAPVFEPNTTYAISILNNICIAGAVG